MCRWAGFELDTEVMGPIHKFQMLRFGFCKEYPSTSSKARKGTDRERLRITESGWWTEPGKKWLRPAGVLGRDSLL